VFGPEKSPLSATYSCFSPRHQKVECVRKGVGEGVQAEVAAR
jgi:hypothetical protein